MKKEDLLHAIGEADPAYVREAEPKSKKKRPAFRAMTLAATAAVLVVAIGVTSFVGRAPFSAVPIKTEPNRGLEDFSVGRSGSSFNGYAVATGASVAVSRPKWDSKGSEESKNAYRSWQEQDRLDQQTATRLSSFCTRLAPALLAAGGEENRLCAPLNVYFALALLAEVTAGKTQAEIFSLMGVRGLADMREVVRAMIRISARDDEKCTALFSNSVWLDNSIAFKIETLETLAGEYGASSYRGDTADPAFSQALRDWLNDATGGLLEDQVKSEGFAPDDIFALASAVYFDAKWYVPFKDSNNTTDVFHGKESDQQAVFMTLTADPGYAVRGDRFLAFRKAFDDNAGSMLFILPDEGVTPEELLNDADLRELFAPGGYNYKYIGSSALADLTVPKFKLSERMDLVAPLKELGVKKVFDGAADFSPLLDGQSSVSRISHGVCVEIDEEGVKAAAYTVVYGGGGYPTGEHIVMRLDRPFLFIVQGPGGVPLFTGIVNQL